MKLHLSHDLSLPIDAATQTFAFIGRKRSGKTYAAGKLVELLLDAQVQVVILDTVGNWYGIRFAADGKGPGYDVPVFGGLRHDLPLEATGGELVADAVSDTGRSVIIDVSQFSLGDRKRFATAFALRLWQRKKAETHPTPLHLVLEESQLLIPQFVGRDDARMVGIFEEIVRLGGNYGIGVSMITQRPQSVNKEALTQTECLVVFQVNGVPERKALKEWIVHHGADVNLLDELPSMEVGTAYLWSPQWLGVLKKITISSKKTLDASATPKVGQRMVRRELKPLDLDDLKTKMAATIERAKADDPRELRKQIAALQRQLTDAPKSHPVAQPKETRVEVPIIKDSQISRLEQFADRLDAKAVTLVERATKVGLLETAKAFQDEAWAIRQSIAMSKSPARTPIAGGFPATASKTVASRTEAAKAAQEKVSDMGSTCRTHESNGETITGPEQRILDAIAWLESLGIGEPQQTAVAFLAGYTYGGGAFNNPRGRLHTRGYIEYRTGDRIRLTEAGTDHANVPKTSLTTGELQSRVLERLPGPEQRILGVLLGCYPNSLEKHELAERAGYAQGGAFNNPLGRLRSLGLIDYPEKGRAVALPVLFLEPTP